eukprot:TRINITY_DN12447_c0_g2_i8.p1 TRINITY_DN12447_c0_g2~~TRINITY_DN12447_c0_g2_i8.p1  ORF type:complete len:223 (-),score=21.56 TRINITY_DN12447_c0_g2_i8:27-695(-)
MLCRLMSELALSAAQCSMPRLPHVVDLTLCCLAAVGLFLTPCVATRLAHTSLLSALLHTGTSAYFYLPILKMLSHARSILTGNVGCAPATLSVRPIIQAALAERLSHSATGFGRIVPTRCGSALIGRLSVDLVALLGVSSSKARDVLRVGKVAKSGGVWLALADGWQPQQVATAHNAARARPQLTDPQQCPPALTVDGVGAALWVVVQLGLEWCWRGVGGGD